MVVATDPKGKMVAMPTSPEAVDLLPPYIQKTLPSFGGVWAEEAEAYAVWGKIPTDVRGHFKVTPVAITFLKRG
jgi:hypothetical protein